MDSEGVARCDAYSTTVAPWSLLRQLHARQCVWRCAGLRPLAADGGRANCPSIDDRKWLPGPPQQGGVFGIMISAEMVKGWHQVLDDADDLLAGKRLLPRFRERGLDVQKLMRDPPPLRALGAPDDKLMEPYLREGELLGAARMRAVEEIFEGNSFYFAAWFN